MDGCPMTSQPLSIDRQNRRRLVATLPKQQHNTMSSPKKQGKEEPAPVIVHTCKQINYEYNFLATLNSLEELDDFRFKRNCNFSHAKRNNFSRVTLHCSKCGTRNTGCRYKLLAIRPNIGEKEYEIHVYAYGEHNHALKPESERLSNRLEPNLFMPDLDPPPTQRTRDGLEWTFLRTIDNLEALKKCRSENGCKINRKSDADANRYRMPCTKSRAKGDCPFIMLAMKTMKWRYHIYTHGQHNHASTSRTRNKRKFGKRRSDSTEDDPEGESSKNSGEDAKRKVDDEQEERMEEEGADEGENDAPPIVKEYSLEKIQRRLGNSLRKGQAERVHKWMGRVDMEQIDTILTGMDLENVVSLMEMADRELNDDRESRNFWRPWIKEARQNHGSELAQIPGLIDRFTSRYLCRKLAKTINEEEENDGGDNKQ